MKNETKNDASGNSTNKTMDYVDTVTKSVINQTDPLQEMESKEEKEAAKLIKKARALNQPKCCIQNICTKKEDRLQEMDNLYLKAGNLYKSVHHWRNAGICYENCSKIKEKLKENPLPTLEKAYYCYEKIGIGDDAKNIFDKMNSYLEKDGKFFQVGKNFENLAIKEENKEKYEKAIDYYLKAVKYYEKDEKHQDLITKILIKLSELMILHNHPQAETKVPTMLERIGYNYLKNIMTKYQAKEYFGKAIITLIYYNDDINQAKEHMKKYKKKDKTFEDSNVYTFCKDIITCIENGENEKLNKVIINYKEIYELNEYMIFVLDNIIDRENQKRKLKEREESKNNENLIENNIE